MRDIDGRMRKKSQKSHPIEFKKFLINFQFSVTLRYNAMQGEV